MNRVSKENQFVLVGKRHPLREKVEQYVRERYAQAFDASLSEFMPTFACILDNGEQILSVCGFRSAESENLFLEQYLDAPAQVVLSNQFNTVIRRNTVIEFGQLASFSRGTSLPLFAQLSQYLVSQGYQWCIFTATGPLHALMQRFGLAPVKLAPASASRLDHGGRDWGSYYALSPHVSAGNLMSGAAQLSLLAGQPRSASKERTNMGGMHG